MLKDFKGELRTVKKNLMFLGIPEAGFARAIRNWGHRLEKHDGISLKKRQTNEEFASLFSLTIEFLSNRSIGNRLCGILQDSLPHQAQFEQSYKQ
jgi:hypothetical protein